MSDIYLQITETPTVVTLSAPVVSGALASTVTVANTVTVALDSNSLSALENVTVTVGAAITGTVTVSNFPATQPVSIASVTVGNSITISSLPVISGTVTVGNTVNFLSASDNDANLIENIASAMAGNSILGITNALPAGTNRIGVVTIGAGTVTIGAGTAQIGSVTASISNSLTIASLPAISGTVTANNANLSSNMDEGDQPVLRTGVYAYDYGSQFQVGVAIIADTPAGPALNIGGTVTANTFAVQGTAVTTSNFTSTTASTVLANFNAGREVLTIFNEGPGNLFVSVGATCTTVQYQVRLSSGDYYEVPNHQTSITHSGVFATAGTARVTEVS